VLPIVGATLVLIFTAIGSTRADETEQPKRPPLPEPIFTETVTDLDGDEAGEVEVEVNGSNVRARRGPASELSSTVELEWLVTRRLGLRLEPSYSRARDDLGIVRRGFGLSGGASWKLHQDFDHDFHSQLEMGGRWPWDDHKTAQAGESALPFYADVRSGIRVAWLTIRGGLGLDAGERAPGLRGSLALLRGFVDTSRFGFFGVELDADGARRAPFVLAPNVVADCTPLSLPFRLALAIPIVLGERATEPSAGLYVRLFFVTGREAEFGKTGQP
jgi:hypothetical protein